MSHASLRKLLVDVYTFSASSPDAETGVARSIFTRVKSPDTHGQWWASRGTVFTREQFPTTNEQQEDTSFWSFADYVPLTPNGVIRHAGQVFRIQGIVKRDYFRGSVQIYATHVDDADTQYTLQEPT